MSIVSRYHNCQLEVWVLDAPESRSPGPIFLNVLRQPITHCLRCGQPLALEDLVVSAVPQSAAAPWPPVAAQRAEALQVAYAG